MLINETSKVTNLTKKAIEYYTEQKLVFPDILANGYRDFNEEDIKQLQKISIFRRLGLSIEEIKTVLADETDSVLQKISVRKELNIQKEQAKKAVLEQISAGKSYSEINEAIKSLEQNATIAERLLDAFPGYYGRFICLHFARFLNEPIITEEQRPAYLEIVAYLDNVQSFEFPEDVQSFLAENTKHLSTQNIQDMNEQSRESIENPERFLQENKEVLEQYLAYKKSPAYQDSPAYKIQGLLKAFNSTSGYYDVFIPAMKRLSASYAEYHRQIEIANKKLLSQYPEIEDLNN
ncbi:MAG: MerR family transcriptional regulator [Peptococcaceae bacterium]